MKSIIALVVLLATWMGALFAQQAVLDRYIDQALRSNLRLRNHQLTSAQGLEALREARAAYLPQLAFVANYTRAGGGRTLDFPVGDLVNPIYQTLNGLTGENRFPTDIKNVNETFLPDNFHETKLRLIQPIYNPAIGIGVRSQEVQRELAEVDRAVYQRELVREVRKTYFAYLQAVAAIDIYDASDALLAELLRVNQRLVARQKATAEVVYQAEFELQHLAEQRAQTEAQRAQLQAYFNLLLDRPLDAPIERDSLAIEAVPPALPSLLARADVRRPEFQGIDRAEILNELQGRLAKADNLPTLNLVVEAGFQGFGYTFDRNQDFYLAQVGLNWNLFRGFQNRSRLQQTRIAAQSLANQRRQLSQQVELQLRTAWHQLSAQRAALEADRAAVAAAEAAYRIINRKYRAQQASWLELTEARSRLTTAQIDLTVDTYAYLAQRAELDWAAGISTQTLDN